MIFTSILAAAALATSGFSSPIEKRAVGGVLLCTGVNATGTCTHKVYEMETCYQLEEPFYENTNTFAPDGEDFLCWPRLYDCDQVCKSPTGCTFGSVTFDYENKYNLGKINWDVLIKSFDCVLNK